ncbi:MAG: PKD domain-containing protein, partial [Bacteroidota bacterium]
MTFCSNDPVNTHIQLYFSYTDIMPSDTLYIYDGPDMTAPLIGAYNNNSAPVLYLMPVNASIYNPTGCLTVRFVSDGSLEATGWAAEISCEPLCQSVVATLDLAITSPSPDTNYIAICPGTPITFAGYGEYSQNDYVYHQSDNTSTFEWHFGDGTTANGSVVTHTYLENGGYNITLFVTDVNGCVSTNSIDTRVIISGSPFTTISPPPVICANDTLELLFSMANDPNTTIGGDPFHVVMDASLGVTDTTFLPDGSGVTYSTSVVFNCFAPGQILHNAWDILSLCANMEHSFLGDLEIKLICPNGQSIILKEYPGGGGTYLGVPIDDDSVLDPGDGWEYCWSPTPTYGTMVAESASYGTLPAGSYAPFQSFAGLVGCPLNGQWTIEVSDNWALDNGYIFSWELSLNPAISPNNWEYTVPIVSMGWTNGPFIISSTSESITVNPTSAGVYEYTYTIVDAIGCTWDTSAFLTVIPSPVVDLGPDIMFCDPAASVTLDATNPGFTYEWNDGSNGATLLADASGIYSVTVSNGTCDASDDISVYYGDMSATTLSTDVSCYGEADGSIALSVTANSPPLTFAWNNGMTSEDLAGIPAGTYTVTITDVNGCNITASATIDGPDEIVISASPDVWICIGQNADLMASATGGTPGYTFQWSNGQTSSGISVNPVTTQSYSVQAFDANGCVSNTDNVNVNVHPPVTVEVSSDKTEICPGDAVVITAVASGGNGNYSYMLSDGTVVYPPFTDYPSDDISYTVVASDDCGSPTDQGTISINVMPLPPISFAPDTTQGCQPLTVKFNENSPDVGQSFTWNFGDIYSNNTSNKKNPVHIFEDAGVYDVTLTVTSADGCIISDVIEDLIAVFPLPDAEFLADPEIISVIKPVVLFHNLTTGAENYHWMFGDGDSSLAVHPYHTYPGIPQTYLVELITESDQGCRDTVYNKIIVKDEFTFFAPNAFSPDGDNANDEFGIFYHGIDPNDFKLVIYDRWGEIIFETNDPDTKWDGNAKA